MRSKRFNNVAMLKENMKRIFEAPYFAAAAQKMMAEYKAQQNMQTYMNPGEVVWVPDNTH